MLYLVSACQFLLGTVFAAAAVGKIRDRDAFAAFATVVKGLGLVPRPWARVTARITVAVEAMVPALLLVALVPADPVETASWWLRGCSTVLAIGLLLAFTVGIVLAVRNGTQASCACFGARGSVLGMRHIIRNTALAVIGGAGLLGHLVVGQIQGSTAGHVLAAFAGVIVASVFVLFDDIAELFVSVRATT
ncbi:MULTISPECIES: MauE/DoxX family redox-associated membrane protein [unclassified Streptomyces]|uniref:MauE/DoxX family redox-associated membrane protein n=1 Tax=unclassified Streptomyces TaxID=2593676 RepID=UPI00336A6FA5